MGRIKKWVFVTGIPRSGSTFLGKVLCAATGVAYLHEPFNPAKGVKGCTKRYLYLDRDSEGSQESAVREAVQMLGNLKASYIEKPRISRTAFVDTLSRAVGGRGGLNQMIARLTPGLNTGILKDPTAFLMADYLFSRHGMKPVIIVRHPASWYASWKRMGWQTNMDLMFAQPAVVQKYLFDDVDLFKRVRTGSVEEAALFWKSVYCVLLTQADKHGWTVIKHEDLSLNPVDEAKKLYQDLALPWSSRVERKIERWTTNNSADAPSGRPLDIRRDSANIFSSRIAEVSDDERTVLYKMTLPISSRFYDEKTFDI